MKRVEIDRLPSKFFEHSNDWADLAVTRLLTEPIYTELPGRGVESKYVRSLVRISDKVWQINLNRNSGVSSIDSSVIAKQIVAARRAKCAGLIPSLMFKEMHRGSKYQLTVETRFPIADLASVLVNPALAPNPSRFENSISSYKIVRSDELCLTIHRQDHEGDELQLTPYSKVDDPEKPDFCVSGPMTTRPSQIAGTQFRHKLNLAPLDIVFALRLPASFPREVALKIGEHLDRAKFEIATSGLVSPLSQLSGLWGANNNFTDQPRATKVVSSVSPLILEFTDYPNNREVAIELAIQLKTQLGISVTTKCCRYDTFADDIANTANAKLVLLSSPWPHPCSILMPFYFQNNASRRFKETMERAMAEENRAKSVALARLAEKYLKVFCPHVVPLGRYNGVMKSKKWDLWCPPSGWINYASGTEIL